MSRTRAGTLLAALLLMPTCARASDLGGSGPFRSLGGKGCPVGTADACTPTPVDAALPRARQVRRHVERALAFLDQLRLQDSRAALDEALRLDPDDVQALTLRGRLSLTNGDPSKARPDFARASRFAPDDPDILADLAAVSPPDEAKRDLDAALARRPDDIDMLFARARNALERGDTAGAFTDLSRDLALAPSDDRARMLRAGLQLKRHVYDLAALDADAVVAHQPWNTQALEIKAAARLGAGDETGAIEAYTVLLEGQGGMRPPPSPATHDALVNRGRLYAKLGRTAEAKRDLATLMEQQGIQALLQLQLYLRGHGYPNVELTGQRTTAFDVALNGCFSERVCGPELFR